ncbi:hypothetical protein [Mycobacteroides stephanolepidis]|uniref:hypothetical protein n=1 Tax=[Mycobacterium] stephanolepidis TaxID=1520670 RepID=UPI001E398CBA|nr:hypothetical protein [[Mycobacterium] stephanolepidis]
MITNFSRFWAAGILAASVVGAVGLAAPAYADGEGEFLQILRDSGPGFTSLDPIDAGLNVHLGNMACETLRNGGTRGRHCGCWAHTVVPAMVTGGDS